VTFPNNRGRDMTDCVANHWRFGENAPPTAADTTVTTSGPIVVDTTTLNATDLNAEDAGYLSISGVGSTGTPSTGAWTGTPAGGTASVADGKVTYRPPTTVWTQDSFYATVTDHYYSQRSGVSATVAKVTVVNSDVYPSGITNGSFSDGLTGWQKGGTLSTVGIGWKAGGTDGATAGPFASMTVPTFFGTASLSQSLLVPQTGSGTLTVWRRITKQGVGCNDTALQPVDSLDLAVTPDGGAKRLLATFTNRDSKLCSWQKAQYDLSAYKGQPVTLSFTTTGMNDASSTKFDIDEISLS
jgi:hypothetical protein